MKLLQNNICNKFVTSQCLCNVPSITLVPYFSIALFSSVKCSVMLWSDNRNIFIIGLSLQGTV